MTNTDSTAGPDWARQSDQGHRLGSLVQGAWQPHRHAARFERQSEGLPSARLFATNPDSSPALPIALLRELGEHVVVLYVLHTPRGEGERGRYSSPWIPREEAIAFLERFHSYLSADGRFDLWLHSSDPDATIVWDRHDFVFAYGPLDRFERVLQQQGFMEGAPASLGEHTHHYRAEFDTDASALLRAFDWTRTPLKPSDEQ